MAGVAWQAVLAVSTGLYAAMSFPVVCGRTVSSCRNSAYSDAGVNAAMMLLLAVAVVPK